MTITVTFKNGTNIDIAQVDVQNRIQSVLPQLPQTVRDLGITVRKGSTDILLIVHMFAADASVDRKYIANYANLQVRERLLRTQGVGDVNINAARDYAMRVWIDPDRAAARDLTVDEIVAALRNNNLQVAGGASARRRSTTTPPRTSSASARRAGSTRPRSSRTRSSSATRRDASRASATSRASSSARRTTRSTRT